MIAGRGKADGQLIGRVGGIFCGGGACSGGRAEGAGAGRGMGTGPGAAVKPVGQRVIS